MPKTSGREKLQRLTCEECGQPYETRGPRTRFCSNKCSAVARERKRPRKDGVIVCAGCGANFIGQLRNYVGKPASKYCSFACYRTARDRHPTFACEWCGQITTRTKSKSGNGYNYLQRFCSKRCVDASQTKPGGHVEKKHGYRILSIRDRSGRFRQIPEHRFIMERTLGRALFDYETVHHRNGVRTDNRPENLEVWIGRHGPGGRLDETLAWYVQVLVDHGYAVTPPPT